MTAPCISASLRSPALPSTSASGTAAVGTQSFTLSLYISLNSPFQFPRQTHTVYFPLFFPRLLIPHFLLPSFIFFSYSVSKTLCLLSISPLSYLGLAPLPSISQLWWPHCFALLSSSSFICPPLLPTALHHTYIIYTYSFQ